MILGIAKHGVELFVPSFHVPSLVVYLPGNTGCGMRARRTHMYPTCGCSVIASITLAVCFMWVLAGACVSKTILCHNRSLHRLQSTDELMATS